MHGKFLNELVRRIYNAPVLGEFISCTPSEEANEMFFFNKEYILQYNAATADYKKKKVPGSSYASKILRFFDQHYRIGELFMESLSRILVVMSRILVVKLD